MIYTKFHGHPPVEYHTKEQADELGIQYIPWREVKETGQWVLSDDGYVLQARVKYITELKKDGSVFRVRRRVVTGLSTSYPHGRRPLIIADHIRTRDYNLTTDEWYTKFDRCYPAVRSLLTKMVLSGNLKLGKSRKYDQRAYDAFIFIAKKIFDEPYRTWYNIRTYFGREEVREQIRKDIAKKAIERGISLDKVFNLIDEAEKLGRSKKDAKILLQIAKEYGAIIGMTSLAKGMPEENENAGLLGEASDPALDEVLNAAKVNKQD